MKRTRITNHIVQSLTHSNYIICSVKNYHYLNLNKNEINKSQQQDNEKTYEYNCVSLCKQFDIYAILHVNFLIMVATKMLEKITNLYSIERKSFFFTKNKTRDVNRHCNLYFEKNMFRLKVIDCRSKFHSSVSFFKPLCNKNQEKTLCRRQHKL